MTEAKNLYQNRRSVYALGKNLPISEQEVLKYAVNSSFAKIATAFNNLGDNEKQMAIVQMKLQYEMLDAQRDTNRILGALFMQLADPINPSQLDNARTAAEVRSR